MVAVRSSEADAFVRKPPTHIHIFLVYGQDAGAVAERAGALARYFSDQPDEAFSLIRMDAEALARAPHLLVDEAQTIGLFGGRRCIRIDARPKSILPALELLLEETHADYKLIIEAGELRRDAPLRRLLERSSSAALIECWPDTQQQLERLLDDEVAHAGLTITPGARQLMTGLLGADRLTTRSEIEKLLLYARDLGSIDEREVEAIASDAGSVVLDAVINAAFTGNRAKVTQESVRVFEDMGASVALMFLLRHTLLLLQMSLELVRGGAADGVVDRYARGFPPSKKTALGAQLRRWSSSNLTTLAIEVSRSVHRTRVHPKLSDAIAQRMLWEVCRRAIRT